MWIFPSAVVALLIALSLPLGCYLEWIIEGRYPAPSWLSQLERRFDTGPPELEAIRLLPDLVQHLPVRGGVCPLEPSALGMAEPRRQRDAGPLYDLQYRHFLPEQH